MPSVRSQMLANDVKKLLDLLLVAENDEDIIAIHGAIRLKLDMIRGIIDGKNK